MKEELDELVFKEKNTYGEIAGKRKITTLKVWNDNCLEDNYMDDTVGIGIEIKLMDKDNNIDEDEDAISSEYIWLTKAQCIILKNYLDSFIRLAETEEKIIKKIKENVKSTDK